jgi:hypothetical protein
MAGFAVDAAGPVFIGVILRLLRLLALLFVPILWDYRNHCGTGVSYWSHVHQFHPVVLRRLLVRSRLAALTIV